MNRDNIFLCIPTLRNAGAERFVTELACSINRDRYHVIVVVTGIFEDDTPFYEKLKKENIKVIDGTASNYFIQFIILLKLLKRYKPVIVHSNVSSVLHMLLPTIMSGRTKHLFTTHSMGYRLFTGFRKKIMKFCFDKGIVIPIAICDTVKHSIEEAYLLPEIKVECVYNGVDTDFFTKQKVNNESNIKFVCVGTLYHVKNHELLIEAFKIVNHKYKSFQLILVGDGELRSELEIKVKKYGLQNNIIFVGNQSDVRKYLSEADVYCCSSKVEGLPISVLEAMACSLPIITTPAGGVVDIVEDGKNGFVVESDIMTYAEKMIELIRNKQLREKMAKESRKKALEYSLYNCAKGYEDLYKKYSI